MLTFIITRIKNSDFIVTTYLKLSLFIIKALIFNLFQFSLYLLIYWKENYANISNEQFTVGAIANFYS